MKLIGTERAAIRNPARIHRRIIVECDETFAQTETETITYKNVTPNDNMMSSCAIHTELVISKISNTN